MASFLWAESRGFTHDGVNYRNAAGSSGADEGGEQGLQLQLGFL
jgi:hypothetical protein